MKPVTTIINRALRKAGLEQRLIRGRGYYYVTGVAVSSMLCVYRLDQTKRDLSIAINHVNQVLAEEGVHVHFDRQAKLSSHPIGYTGYLRRCYALGNAPSNVADWRESF
jgi:hypothetical protein